jgi:predicted dehydrogenase
MGIKLGIIGYGGMASWHRNNAIRVPGVEVIAAYDIDPARVEAAKKDGLVGYNTLGELLSNPDINLVLVATPNHIHKEMVIAALNAGKNAISEKPVTLTVKDLDEMIACSVKNSKIFTVHQNRRWDHDYKVAKEVFDSGVLGKIYTVQSRLFGSGGIVHGWRAIPEYGGCMVYDWGVHFLDQLLNMIPGKITSINADLHSVKNPLIDDYFNIMLKFDSGITAITELGTFLLKDKPRWYIGGNAGTMVINDFNGANGSITKVSKLAEMIPPVIVQTAAGPTRTFAPQPPETKEESSLPVVKADWVEYYANVRDVIDGKAELIVKPAQVRRVLQVIEKVFESSTKGQSVSFE